MDPDSLVSMVIKQSRLLASCMRCTTGSILIEGYYGALVERKFWGYCFKYPFIVGMEGDKCLEINWATRPSKLVKFLLLIAEMRIYLVWQTAASSGRKVGGYLRLCFV